ncbi:hypothetical protein BVRB_5g101060 [Beta vulgaris subsp. vulgaris]|nr:hypothetical protein BVRB_5g101060 [Beta vulgaris subsp. vulgaris]
MGSNHQHQNQIPEEFVPLQSSTMSYQDSYYLSQNGGSSMWGSSNNLSNSVIQMLHQNGLFISGNINVSQQSNPTNTRTSIEESSLITDANSSFSGVSYLPSNGDSSIESLASNCRRIAGTSTGNYLPAQQQIVQAGQTYPGWYARQGDQLFNSQLMIPEYQASVPLLMNKKPRLEMKPDDVLRAYTLQQLSSSQVPMQLHQQLSSSQVPVQLHQQISPSEVPMQLHQQLSPSQVPMQLNQQLSPSQVPMQLHQQLSPGQVPMQLQNYDPVVASRLFQQHLIQNQQQNQSPLLVPSSHRHLMQCLTPQQLPRDTQKQSAAIIVTDANVCSQRLMSYMNYQRHRPPDNNIDYWRKFVEEYYSPSAKRRWCFSKTRNGGCQDYGIDSWKCDLCGSNSGKGFEICFEALPRMKQIYFMSGVVDELICLDIPVERRLPSGFMILYYEKAVLESVYKHSHVVHEGQLRIIFTRELKIISWEFCIRSHEELVSRRLVATQVNELVQVAAKCRSNNELKETEGVPAQDLLSDCNRVVAAGKNLRRNLELPLINDLGFPKQFVRCVQMFDVLNSMKDLMAYNQANNSSPIETLKRYHQQAANAKVKKQMQCQAQMQQIPNADRSNFQVARSMTQTPDASEQQQAMFDSPNYHQNSMMEEHRITSDLNQSFHNKPSSSSMPYQHLNSSANISLGPSSSRNQPTIKHQINDLLMIMHTQRIKGNCRNNRRGKRRLMYDLIEETEMVDSAEQTKVGTVEKEANTSHILGGISDKGKGYNYSSSSNSSAKIFADNCVVKKEAVSDDDDSTSPTCYQRPTC